MLKPPTKRKDHHSIEELERTRDNRTFWLIATLAIVGSLIGLYISVYQWRTDDPLLREVRSAVISACASTAFFGVFFSLLTRADYNSAIRHALVSAFGDSEEIFASLSPNTKRLFVRNSLHSTLGDEIGAAVYQDLVEPILSHAAGYRRQYRYDIEALDGMPQPSSALQASPQAVVEHLRTKDAEYLWLHQCFQYERFAPQAGGTHRGRFQVYLTMTKDDLQDLLIKDHIFFRENIEIDDECRSIVEGMTLEELSAFVRHVLRFKVEELKTESDVDFEVSFEKARRGRLIISILTDSIEKISGSMGIKVSFVFPQFRAAPWFVVSLPQPCQNPVVSFRRNRYMSRLEPVLFLPNVDKDRIHMRWHAGSGPSSEPSGVEIRVDGWTFPTSGAMFTWRPS